MSWQGALAEVCGKISSAKGAVEILRLKVETDPSSARLAQKAKKRMKVLCNDIIVTHQAARIKLRLNKAILTLGPNSRLEVAAESKGSKQQELALSYGKVRTFFKGKAEKGQAARFKVKTPAAVVGVRGTDFYVAYKPNEKVAEQATLTGKVEVVQKATNIKVEVEKGQRVEIDNYDAKLKEAERKQNLEAEKKKAEELAQIEKQKLDEEARQKAIKELEEKTRIETLAKKKALEEELKLKVQKMAIVKAIDESTATEIKQISALVKNDKEFTSDAAVKVLGNPETWTPPLNEQIPEQFRDYENEF